MKGDAKGTRKTFLAETYQVGATKSFFRPNKMNQIVYFIAVQTIGNKPAVFFQLWLKSGHFLMKNGAHVRGPPPTLF